MMTNSMTQKLDESQKIQDRKKAVEWVLNDADAVLMHAKIDAVKMASLISAFVEDLKEYTGEEIISAYKQHRKASKQFPSTSDLLARLPQREDYHGQRDALSGPLDGWVFYQPINQADWMRWCNFVCRTVHLGTLTQINQLRAQYKKPVIKRYSQAEMAAVEYDGLTSEQIKQQIDAKKVVAERLNISTPKVGMSVRRDMPDLSRTAREDARQYDRNGYTAEYDDSGKLTQDAEQFLAGVGA